MSFRYYVALMPIAVVPSSAFALDCATTAGLAVDADGAPDSYRIDGKGLSYTCDGVFAIVNGVAQTQKNNKDHWQALCAQYWSAAKASGDYSKVKIVGFQKDAAGRPEVQSDADPLPGQAYITTTSLTIPGTPDHTQRHYVDASQIPYVVLSPGYASAHQLRLGDVVAVYRPLKGRLAFGVYGDCCSLGEASVRLHQDLGNDPIVVRSDGTRRAKHGIGEKVVFVALTGAHTTPTLDVATWRSEITAKGRAALDALGGQAAIAMCAARSGSH